MWDHNFVYVFGDLNFRVAKDNKSVRDAVRNKNLDYLRQADELLILMKALKPDADGVAQKIKTQIKKENQVMGEFSEGKINFPPTYKFDKGTLHYDTSKKQRVPSWTDRIIWRDNINSSKLLEYDAKFQVAFSDHIPVYGIFEVTAKK